MYRNIVDDIKENINILEWRITFYKTFRFFGIQKLANKFPEQYERFWTYLFPAENIVLKFSKK